MRENLDVDHIIPIKGDIATANVIIQDAISICNSTDNVERKPKEKQKECNHNIDHLQPNTCHE